MTARPGRVDFRWDAEGISVIVRRIHAHSDGKVSAHIQARAVPPAVSPGLLHRADLNLSATRSKREFAKALLDAWPLWDWGLAVELICDRTLDYLDEGEPAEQITVDPEDEVPPPRYLLNPLLPLGMPTILYGEGGTVKSTLAIGLALTALLPWENNPFGLIPPPTPHHPLFLDWEMDADTFRYRTSLYLRGHQLPAVQLLYRRCFIPLPQDIEHIQDIVTEHSIDFIIIDSLGAATGGDLNLSEGPLSFFAAIRQLAKTTLILAHTSKNKEGDRGVYGNVHFGNYARSIWEVLKSQELKAADLRLALVHRKFNLSGQLQPIGLHFTFAPSPGPASSLSVEYADALGVEGVIARFSLRTRIMETLKRGPLSATILAPLVGKRDASDISSRLSEMKRAGAIVSLPGNLWALAAKPTDLATDVTG